MKWYYSANREKLGPVDEVAFEHLVAAGVITDQTLVWHKGMPEWRPYGEAKGVPTAPVAEAPPPPPAPATEKPTGGESSGVTCVSCGAFLLMDDTVRFRDDFVCLECREDYVRKQDEAKLAEEARDTPDEELREAGLKHERRIRTAAVMYYFVGVLLSVLALGSLVNGKPGVMVICLLFAVPILFAAREVMGFRRRAKLAACCVSGFGLILLPLGTVLHLYVLYIVCNKEAKQVFAEHYREVIDRTPHLKPGISWIVAVLLCVLHFIAFQLMG